MAVTIQERFVNGEVKRDVIVPGDSLTENLPSYLYPTLSPEALNVQKEMRLDDEQTLLYDYLCRGDFYFKNHRAAQLFKPTYSMWETGIEARSWTERKLRPLIKKGLIKLSKDRDSEYPRHTNWIFWDARYEVKNLVGVDSAPTMHCLKERLHLPDGWFKKGNCDTHGLKTVEKEYNWGTKISHFIYKNETIPFYRCLDSTIHDLEKAIQKLESAKS